MLSVLQKACRVWRPPHAEPVTNQKREVKVIQERVSVAIAGAQPEVMIQGFRKAEKGMNLHCRPGTIIYLTNVAAVGVRLLQVFLFPFSAFARDQHSYVSCCWCGLR